MIQNDNGINVLDKNEDALKKGKIYALEVVCATETEDNGKWNEWIGITAGMYSKPI